MRPRRTISVLVAAAAIAVAAVTAEAAVGQTQTSVRTGVVDVETTLAYQGGAAAGTGIVISSSGIVVTNNHVIRGATTVRVVDPSTRRSYQATVLGYDIAADVAVLKLSGASGLKTVRLGNSSTLRKGAAVTAVGNAGGTGSLAVTKGTVTALSRAITVGDTQSASQRLTGLIETNAALEPGDSGGPLLDRAGRVVGIDAAAAASFVAQSSGNEGYAIPINKVRSLAQQIEAGHSSTAIHVGATAFLGVSVQATTYSQSGTPTPAALVTVVVPGSPADKAGLVVGDLITSLAGKAAGSPSTLADLVLHQAPGAKVPVGWVDQSGNQQTADVTLASGPPQ